VKWTILICSVCVRTERLKKLLKDLSGQIGNRSDVSVLVSRDNCQMPLGEKRTSLIEAATGEYVCFVDDDDLVASDYVGRIMEALESDPDYVGFKVRVYENGRSTGKVAFHSIKYPNWTEDGQGYYRHITHLNPIRREIALDGLPYTKGYGEDQRWSDAIWRTGKVKSEVFIDKVMYLYLYSQHPETGSLHKSASPKECEWTPNPKFRHVEYLV
jgi:glycosyltransferase involved in cell wall biosynthesis